MGMLRALYDLGRQLRNTSDTFPPVGFYNYGEPIRWAVHIGPESARLESVEIEKPRPYSGRSSDVQAHALVDEAAYALGVEVDAKGKVDKRAGKKHGAFLELLDEAYDFTSDTSLKEAIGWVKKASGEGWLRTDPEWDKVINKAWVSFSPSEGALEGQHLFELPDMLRFWSEEAQRRCEQRDESGRLVQGACAITGKEAPLVAKIPLKVKLNSTAPLHSLNQDAFVSFVGSASTAKKAHIGLGFEAGDTAARAFNYLSNSSNYRQTLVFDKNSGDSLKNHIALYWVDLDSEIVVENEQLDSESILERLTMLINNRPDPKDRSKQEVEKASQLDLPRIRSFLKQPWAPSDSSRDLRDISFYLAILSPNVGRIALRDWTEVPLEKLQDNMTAYLDALSVVTPSGFRPSPVSIGTIMGALTPIGAKSTTSNPGIQLGLLRCAYRGYPPPQQLLSAAVARFRVPSMHKEPWRTHALAAAMKLALTYGTEEVATMQVVDETNTSAPYLYGRQFAIIEQAQERSQYLDRERYGQKSKEGDGGGTNRMLVERFYGGVSTSPGTTMPQLYTLFETAYLPKIGRQKSGTGWLKKLMEDTCLKLQVIPEAERYRPLSPKDQAEFALGFYCQRAGFRRNNAATTGTTEAEEGDAE
ncbi:MAG: type I-C CRISPR-associated protein Cas8c/Csd1 [Truepera sp.]|nr:type I-C CRISPR-associated protein Cas8c/Csd1 [Truepera sp.]